ncbi:hypothetical protein [Pacificoceanicola onchidii]|uniref:hypothetical protein n=1 Tax=Pacificoceanicola onchidii TaxID=2562685 RepID=UPI0010A66A2F|nr:hypothetical protein [Pacificoceanicola onchidii]
MPRISHLLTTVALGAALAAPACAELLSGTNPSIRNNLCVGSDCVDDESFDSDFRQLKMKGNSTRVIFEDTSTATGFPSYDWAIQANDRLVNGEDQLIFVDETNNAEVMAIKGGAPAASLVVDAQGRIGFGTEMPQADLHMVSSSVSKVRLQHTNSGADWEISIGSDGFGLLDRDGLQAFPFFLENGAPTNSMWLEDTGDLGLGTSAPTAPVHIRRNDNSARILILDTGSSGAQEMFAMVNNGGSYFTLDNTDAGTTWYFVHENAAPNRFIISDAVADGPEMSLTADGDLTIPGQLFTAGSCAAGCDRVFDEDYPLPSIAEQAAMMRERKHLPNVGPTPEDGPFNITAMTGGMLNELEKAHLYIAELHEQNAAMAAQMAAQARENTALAARLDRIEALLLKP